MGQERLGPSYFFIPLALGPLNSLVWYVPSLRYTRGLGWHMHCGAEVTESSTNKQHHLSLSVTCLKHLILIVRLPLTLMLLTSSLLSRILTGLSLFLCFLWGAYRDCFHVFLSLCVLFRFLTWRAHHSQPLFATRTCVLAFFFLSVLLYQGES